jgi:GAF domain-containing protein
VLRERVSPRRRYAKYAAALDGWHVEEGGGEGTDARWRRRYGMSDRTPRPIEYMLRDVREALQMDVAFVSQFSEDRLVFRALEGDAESFGWQEGESFPIDESYCKRVLDGRIPRVVPNAKREDTTRDLRVTSEADIGSYAAVPLVLSDGRLYGTLCCLSHEPDPWLRERDLGLMERTARWLVEQLERHGGP